MITEVRIYKLKVNSSNQFLKIFTKQSLPMMRRWKIQVVDYGFSLIDKNSFYLIRNYDNLEERQSSQNAFYESVAWINGPEKEIMNCIDTYNTTVIESSTLLTKLNYKKNG